MCKIAGGSDLRVVLACVLGNLSIKGVIGISVVIAGASPRASFYARLGWQCIDVLACYIAALKVVNHKLVAAILVMLIPGCLGTVLLAVCLLWLPDSFGLHQITHDLSSYSVMAESFGRSVFTEFLYGGLGYIVYVLHRRWMRCRPN